MSLAFGTVRVRSCCSFVVSSQSDVAIEHQRPDSIFDLFFTCANVPGYHDLERHLQQNPGRHVWAGGPNEGQPLTMLDFCTHGELSLASEYREIWDGLDWVPFSFDYMVSILFRLDFEH